MWGKAVAVVMGIVGLIGVGFKIGYDRGGAAAGAAFQSREAGYQEEIRKLREPRIDKLTVLDKQALSSPSGLTISKIRAHISDTTEEPEAQFSLSAPQTPELHCRWSPPGTYTYCAAKGHYVVTLESVTPGPPESDTFTVAYYSTGDCKPEPADLINRCEPVS